MFDRKSEKCTCMMKMFQTVCETHDIECVTYFFTAYVWLSCFKRVKTSLKSDSIMSVSLWRSFAIYTQFEHYSNILQWRFRYIYTYRINYCIYCLININSIAHICSKWYVKCSIDFFVILSKLYRVLLILTRKPIVIMQNFIVFIYILCWIIIFRV